VSRDNVEVVREMLERYSADDVDGFLAYWEPDAEWTGFVFERLEGKPRAYRGHAGLRHFHADSHEAFAEQRIEVTEFRDVGSAVLALGEFRAEGVASGAAIARQMGWLFELQDGKIVRGRDYLDQQEALEAAGLRER
jgi:ketosteroid isomerase-like protein